MNMHNEQMWASLPPWMQAEKVSLAEKLEIMMFKFVSLFPLVVTFGLYAFLGTYFIGVIIKS